MINTGFEDEGKGHKSRKTSGYQKRQRMGFSSSEPPEKDSLANTLTLSQ